MSNAGCRKRGGRAVKLISAMGSSLFFLILALQILVFGGCASGDNENGADPDGDTVDGDAGDVDDEEELRTDGDDADADQEDEASTDGDGEEVLDGDEEADSDEEYLQRAPLDCLIDPECRQVMVVAHRGLHIEHPENSLAAMRAAASVGSHFVEIDVQVTLDEALVLMHDGEVDRTTDGTGKVSDLSLAQIEALTLSHCETGNDESCRVPLFSESLALARSLSIMIYLDQKTGRTDLVLAEIQAGEYYDVALVRDDFDKVLPMVQQDDRLLIMPPVDSDLQLNAFLQQYPELLIVEIGSAGPWPELASAIIEAGVKTQQDIMVGDIQAEMFSDYSTWKSFVDTGVILLQTDVPHLLVPAVDQYNRTGVFPDTGPEL